MIVKYDENFDRYGILNLTGLTIDKNGFLVLCVSEWAGGKCTSVLGAGSFVDAPGTDKYSLTSCVTCRRIDSYGFGCSPELHDYTNGRAVRKVDAEPKPFEDFNLDHWIIIPGPGSGSVSSDGADPGAWVKETLPPSPTPPASAPSKGGGGPSKGGSAPSKGKRRVVRSA